MYILYALAMAAISLVSAAGVIWLLGVWERQKAVERSWKRLIFVVFAAFFDGALGHAGFHLLVHPVAVLGILNLQALIYSLFRGSFWIFQLEVIAIWAAWISGWITEHGGVDERVIGEGLIASWALAAVTGGLLMLAKKWAVGRGGDSKTGDESPPATQPKRSGRSKSKSNPGSPSTTN